jgi:hypothetical protein
LFETSWSRDEFVVPHVPIAVCPSDSALQVTSPSLFTTERQPAHVSSSFVLVTGLRGMKCTHFQGWSVDGTTETTPASFGVPRWEA